MEATFVKFSVTENLDWAGQLRSFQSRSLPTVAPFNYERDIVEVTVGLIVLKMAE